MGPKPNRLCSKQQNQIPRSLEKGLEKTNPWYKKNHTGDYIWVGRQLTRCVRKLPDWWSSLHPDRGMGYMLESMHFSKLTEWYNQDFHILLCVCIYIFYFTKKKKKKRKGVEGCSESRRCSCSKLAATGAWEEAQKRNWLALHLVRGAISRSKHTAATQESPHLSVPPNSQAWLSAPGLCDTFLLRAHGKDRDALWSQSSFPSSNRREEMGGWFGGLYRNLVFKC